MYDVQLKFSLEFYNNINAYVMYHHGTQERKDRDKYPISKMPFPLGKRKNGQVFKNIMEMDEYPIQC